MPATVTSTAGKSTGKYYNCFNVKNDNDGTEQSVDLGAVEWRVLQENDNEEVNIVMIPRKEHGKLECVKTKERDLSKLEDFDTFEVVSDTGQLCISTTWVLWWKGDVVHSRLMACGFAETQCMRSDSPTVDKSSLRVIMSVCAANKWERKTRYKISFSARQEARERRVSYFP